ncbi:MAG: methyltransferase domain-containing protein [Holosporaceae bacterium]|jgi:malonyl-ACP O-methyltransferase BioC|nr:methyltransferase domain-containing protein [Holosporaceae bacterium]
MKEKIKCSFDEACKTYDFVSGVHVLSSSYLADILRELNLQPKSVLDVGCGTGNTSAELMKIYPNAEYTLCDLSEKMIQQALLKVENSRSIVCDAEKYNFSKNYDLGVSNLAMQWFESIGLFLEKILKNCNYFAFSTLLDKSFSDCISLVGKCKIQNYPTSKELKRICQKHKLVRYEIKRYDLSFENQFGLARYFKKLGAAFHSDPQNTRQKLEGQKINLNYELAFAILQ